jgi:hypothetical protein
MLVDAGTAANPSKLLRYTEGVQKSHKNLLKSKIPAKKFY